MKTKMVITDLTRMYSGRVCIAGYTGERQCIRPVLPPPGISENSLYIAGEPVLYPFALVELDLHDPTPQPPHTEDHRFVEGTISYVRKVHSREKVLEWSLFESVSAIFEQTIHDDFGYYVMDCQGPRSLGTIRPSSIQRVIYEPGEDGNWDYRLVFSDRFGNDFRLKITDLTWQYYCQSIRGPELSPAQIARKLTQTLRKHKVYIRIGLARGWKKFPERCYLQVTGIFTFPDHLDGKIFADFAHTKNNK